MHEFHQKYIQGKYNAKLLFTETDSLLCEMKTYVYVYEDFYGDKDLFHFSDYPEDSNFLILSITN